MEIRPIKTKSDYDAAMRRIEAVWGAAPGTSESDELEVLVTLAEAYEREHYPIDLPDPVEAIKFRLEQEGKDYRALIGVIGQRTRVYEVMRQLHNKLAIPAEVLIQPARKPTRRAPRIMRSRRPARRSA